MTIPQIIASVWLTVGPVACVFAYSTFHASSRADDLSRTRNNAAGEKGEGRGVKAFDTHSGDANK